MKELLLRRQVDFFLPKEKVAPWTIAETAADYSRNLTLAEMRGSKYLPGCYVPFPSWSGARRLPCRPAAPPGWCSRGWPAAASRRSWPSASPACWNRTATRSPRTPTPATTPTSSSSFAAAASPCAGGLSLYRDVAEKLGIATHPGSGIATFGELLAHLNTKWKDDRVAGRRLILVIDGLNEAPEPARCWPSAGDDRGRGVVSLVQDRGLDPAGVAPRLVGQDDGAGSPRWSRPGGSSTTTRPAAAPTSPPTRC